MRYKSRQTYDRKIIIERGINCRELECAVLGNDEPIVSVVGEVVSSGEFYDYNAKYIDGKSQVVIPADLPQATAEEVRRQAIKAFLALDLSGLSRVDFFLERETNKVYINEVNTLPGFTEISMYPKLWEASGLSYPQLLDRLIELAIERHADRQRNKNELISSAFVDRLHSLPCDHSSIASFLRTKTTYNG